MSRDVDPSPPPADSEIDCETIRYQNRSFARSHNRLVFSCTDWIDLESLLNCYMVRQWRNSDVGSDTQSEQRNPSPEFDSATGSYSEFW